MIFNYKDYYLIKMSLIEYAKDKNMDIVTMDNLLKKFKKNNDNLELIQLLEFMAERINILSKKTSTETSHKVKDGNKSHSSEQNGFQIQSFKMTTTKLYLIIGENQALEYEFNKDNISKCYELIDSGRIDKTLIGTIFKKVTI